MNSIGKQIRSLTVLAAVLLSINAQGAVFKCPSVNGGFDYSDKPCPEALRKEGIQWVNVDEDNRKKQLEKAARDRHLQVEREQQQQKIRAEIDAKVAAHMAAEAKWEREKEQAIIQAKANGWFVVEYVVDGTAKEASLTYKNESGGSEQRKVALPWKSMYTVSRGYFAYISAQNLGEYGGVSVQILLNGTRVKSSDSYGRYTIATASGKI